MNRKGRFWPTIPAFALSAFCLAVPSAAKGQAVAPVVIGYRVNVDSFGGFFADDPMANPVSAIRFAFSQWTATGGIAQHFVYQGTTTRTSCGLFNPNMVVARQGCHSDGCHVGATWGACPFGGWVISIYEGAGPWAIGFPRPGFPDLDFHQALLHEIGHSGFIEEHVEGDNCVMNSVAGSPYFRFFCRNEMLLMQDRFGLLQLPMGYLTSEGNPAPTSWFSHNVSGHNAAGRGFLDFREMIDLAASVPKIVVADAGNRYLYDTEYPHLNWSPLPVPGASQMRPTVALDTHRNTFWLFWREDTHDGRNAVQYATRYASDSAWTFHGRISLGKVEMDTRLPVAASYDWRTDRVVVVYVQRHAGDLLITSTPASTHSWRAPVVLTDVRAVGVPVMACEHSFSARRCEVAVASSHRFRNFRSFGFGLLSDGAIEYVSGVGLMNVMSSFPPGMAHNGVYGQGHFTFAFRNDPDGLVRYRTKPDAASWWGSTQSTGFYAGPAGTPIQLFDDTVGGGYWIYAIFHALPQ